MKILVVWLVLHEMRLAESSVHDRLWSEVQQQQQQQQQQRFEPIWLPSQNRAATEIAELLNQRWVWSRNTDDLLRIDLDLLPEQGKRTTAAISTVDAEGLGPSWIRSSEKSVCSCESQEKVQDLGSGHYPRYLPSSRCKPETCQNKFYPCRLIKYTVYVLRLQDTSNNVATSMLPESLRHKWLMKPITVTVACVPASNTRRN